jgi:serine protease Do
MALVALAALVIIPLPSGALERESLDVINKAVFEVIIPKPLAESLTYEKPLPLDLIPFAIRNDKYFSVGTAFAISPTELVTAAHVLNLERHSQISDIAVRDKDGKVYSVDKIIKYSGRRDFVVFTLKDKTVPQFFRMELQPQTNQKVYAVGNALGEGIVIRDGLYTSDTPEEINGEWKWIRFSAAASPGNSGGPLLDAAGRVVGVVVSKSPNENLNMALPVSEVINSKDNTAYAFWKLKYFLDNMDMTKTKTYTKELALPRHYSALRNELTDTLNNFSTQLLKELLEENRAGIFPNGPGSMQLLHSSPAAVFPGLIGKGNDGNWAVFSAKGTNDADLGNNGRITYGVIGYSVFMHIQKPDNVATDAFYGDSKLFMDLLLKGLYIHRNVESEKIKITSMGKASLEYIFADSYGRKWVVREWLMEYNDRKVVIFLLPVPGGYVAMMRIGQTGQVDDGYVPDMKVLADFMYLSYYGTLKQWKEFLSLKELLPAAFRDIDISFEYGKNFSYGSKRLSIAYDNSIMKITEDSDLQLRFAYFREDNRTVWDVQSVGLGEDKSRSTAFRVARNIRPVTELSDKYQSVWKNLENRQFPYNRSSYTDDKVTVIATCCLNGSNPAADVLYSASHLRDGNVEQKPMEEGLDRFLKGLTLFEGTAAVLDMGRKK